MKKPRKTSRKKGTRKPSAARKARAATAKKKIELRPIRRQIEAHRKALRSAEQTLKVKRALRRLKRCLDEIRGICGPDMSIPLS